MTDDASKAAQAYKISQRLRELSDAAPEQEDHPDGTR